MRRALLAGLLVLIVLLPALAVASPRTDQTPSPITITPVNPLPGSQTADRTPTIKATLSDTAGSVYAGSIVLYIDSLNCTGFQGFSATATSVTCAVPSILALKNGLHNVTVSAYDTGGNFGTFTWNFTINPNATGPGAPVFSISAQTILLYLGVAAGVAGAVFFGYILYLRQTTRFAFRKYFATHPVQRSYLVLYIPCAAAVVFLIVGLDYVTGTPGLPFYALDLVFIGAIFVALTAFGIDSRYQLARLRLYERAFAQFLFEMADAMRGGLDPAKSIVELSKTQTNILAKPLRIAADGIRIGRPFEAVLEDMARPIRSALISRYAALIAEATTVGGDTATVIYRAAKDMDDFVKIEQERANQLTLPVAVIYISFGVLMAVLFALLFIAPTLGTLNIGFLTPGSSALKGSAAPSIPRLTVSELHERFFELTIINSIGTGAIIGAFTEGRVRYGILHGLALVAATTVLFLFIFP
ncbi:MAG TPA: type II secretion system F family protein [Thermoplasmata archaeon]|nr:type II secretion system F family protein [Thermoplasmata archaeon]